MYAIVKTGGKQYRVEKGQTLLVERLPEDAGETVALQPLMYRSDDALFDAASLAKVSVKARIVAHERGEKLRIFKFKPKRGYKRRTGHRQELTRIEVLDITHAAAVKASAAKAPVAKESAAKAPAAKGPAAKAASAEASAAKAPAAKAARKKPAPKQEEASDGA